MNSLALRAQVWERSWLMINPGAAETLGVHFSAHRSVELPTYSLSWPLSRPEPNFCLPNFDFLVDMELHPKKLQAESLVWICQNSSYEIEIWSHPCPYLFSRCAVWKQLDQLVIVLRHREGVRQLPLRLLHRLRLVHGWGWLNTFCVRRFFFTFLPFGILWDGFVNILYTSYKILIPIMYESISNIKEQLIN